MDEKQTHTIDVVSVSQSKILNVSLYTGRAEITRSYNITVQEGLNTLNILGLPNVMENESLRVEGRGTALIHDVSVSEVPPEPRKKTSPVLEDLRSKKSLVEKALVRCGVNTRTLKLYMENLSFNTTETTGLQDIINQHNEMGGKIDKEELELEKQLKTIEDIETEKRDLAGNALADTNPLMKKKVSISLFSEKEALIEVVLTYAVGAATWDPIYDVRANTQGEEKPVTVVYKATITQATGESWNKVPLTLETAFPTYDVSVPELQPWSLEVNEPHMHMHVPTTIIRPPSPVRRSRSRSPVQLHRYSRSPDRARHARRRRYSSSSESRQSRSRARLVSPPPLLNQVVSVTSKGNVNATFRVPGLITIPGDGQAHNVVVAELKFDAALSWVSVPKIDQKVHLHAKIRNDSEYTFITGPASIYVDGSFIAKTNLPAVSPWETFDCALGPDPSIRITYHPLSKRASQSGVIPFTQKTSSTRYSQRITILNTKTKPVQLLKIRDIIPVSEDEQIVVKLISPALTIPNRPSKSPSSQGKPTLSFPTKETSRTSFSASSLKSALSSTATKIGGARGDNSNASMKEKSEALKEIANLPGTVAVSKAVLAQWADADEPHFEEASMGKNGMINWLCSLQPGETVNCMMEWDVAFPAGLDVVGL
ncbi:hypothetical protein K435DRAFT_968434 [Dendrothele bispora CBS 962.96]|uniref:Mucoidy inhibitor A n=1 Tax=Dendrothele bispora (strain CBS 962.96) TaxID=1314807 RepID=A0A4S8LNL1_DENBC|nr:hypothetical protein K435DRAFT_968434 [Dendrothele bispora CBS 962.96]